MGAIRATNMAQALQGTAYGGLVIAESPLLIESGQNYDLKGREFRPGATNTSGIFTFPAGGGTIRSSLGSALVDCLNQCPVWVQPNLTSANMTIGGGAPITMRSGTYHDPAAGNPTGWETELVGGTRTTQTLGGHIIQDIRFEYMKIRYGGMNHAFRRLVFYKSPGGALQMSLRPSTWGDDDRNGCNGVTIKDILFDQCGQQWTSGTDDGILYAGRRDCADLTTERLNFSLTHGGADIYADDNFANWHHKGSKHTGGIRSFLIGGGHNVWMLDIVDSAMSLASVWDDRANVQNCPNGTLPGAPHYGDGKWHSKFHDGAAGTHAGIGSGGADLTWPVNSTSGIYASERAHIQAGGAAAWLARVNGGFPGSDYNGVLAAESSFSTSGKLIYSYSGGTPAPTGNAGSASLPSGVVSAIVVS